jgi:hypothetical protein
MFTELSEERTTSIFRVEELAMEASSVKINKDKYEYVFLTCSENGLNTGVCECGDKISGLIKSGNLLAYELRTRSVPRNLFRKLLHYYQRYFH